MKNYIVLHTHWDREWYFTTSDSLVLMDRTFKNIINELELYPSISFCLDGQYSIIEEFLNINPELEAKVKSLVAENRLLIGPWYTQTDTQLVDGESMIRNLYYGMKKTKDRFGKVMEVGYLPDTFGFCHQMPEIYSIAGINNAVFWRGADFSQGMKPYFHWQGAGKSTVNTINLFGGYGMAKGFNTDSQFIEKTLKQIINNYRQLGISGELVIPVGNDQFEIKADVPLLINDIKRDYDLSLEVTDYQHAIESIFADNNFDTYACEFRKTAYTRLHKSIGSVRYDLKQTNYQAEQLLINEVEPLFIIAKQFNINPSINLLYSAWALLFEGHAHDGICGCISDAVYQDMKNRIKRATEIGESLKNLILKEISNQLKVASGDVLIVNTSPIEQQYHTVSVYSEHKQVMISGYDSELIETEVIAGRDDALVETAVGNVYQALPEMYKHMLLVKCPTKPYEIKVLAVEPMDSKLNSEQQSAAIANQFISLEVVNNQINMMIGAQTYQNLISVIDIANDGDTYDFSPLIDDQEIEYKVVSYQTQINNLSQTLIVKLNAQVPFALEDRKSNNKLIDCDLELSFELRAGEKLVRSRLKTNNQTLSHKLAVRINCNQLVNRTYSSSAFGAISREVILDQAINDWESSNVEKPVSIETFDGFVKAEDCQLTLLSSYGKEYQAHNNYIDLTVFATTGELGKSDLVNRPGRASGDVTKKGHIKIDTPCAQCLGPVNFEFGLTVNDNDYFECMKSVQVYRTGSVNYQVQEINKFELRIDNKLMDYRSQEYKVVEYQPIEIATNSYITSIGISLDGKPIVRGVANANHQIKSNRKLQAIDLLGEPIADEYNKFMIFNYEMES